LDILEAEEIPPHLFRFSAEIDLQIHQGVLIAESILFSCAEDWRITFEYNE